MADDTRPTGDCQAQPCAHGWAEGCEYHLPDDYREWCSPCRLRVVLRDVRLDEWVQEHRPEWCYRIDHLAGSERDAEQMAEWAAEATRGTDAGWDR